MGTKERLELIKHACQVMRVSNENAIYSNFRQPEEDWDYYLVELPKKGYWTASFGGEHSIPIRHEEPSSVSYITERQREAERILIGKRKEEVEKEKEAIKNRRIWEEHRKEEEKKRERWERMLAEDKRRRIAQRVLPKETDRVIYFRNKFLVTLRDSVGRETDNRIIIDPEKHYIRCKACGQEDLLLFLKPLNPPKAIEIAAKFCMKHDHDNKTEES